MTDHDPQCPWPNREPSEHCMFCAAVRNARADERKRMAEDNTGDPSASWHLEYLQDGINDLRERIKAMGRMLLDSGDITPMGVRMLNKIMDEEETR